jgi:hypothetical protein
MEVERFVRPFAAASAWVESQPAAVVILPTASVWYGRDLVRNDPYFGPGPRVMYEIVSPAGLDTLERRFPGRVRVVQPAELVRLGMEPVVGSRDP